MFPRSIAAVLFLLVACAAPESFDVSRGWAGAGSSFEYVPHEGAPWSFEVVGKALRLTYGGRALTLADAVPADGLVYDIQSLSAPDLTFDLVDGHRARWTGPELLVADAAYRFADGPREIRLPQR